MGSEQFERYPGLKRASEGAKADPTVYTVIGVDIDAERLIAKYKGSKQHGYAEEVVRAVVQKYRTAKAPPASFVDLCRGGIHEPVILCDLGADAKGKSWAVVVDGRQRVMAARTINAERNGIALDVAAVFRPFKRATAGLDATLVKVASNCRVPRTLSQRAEDAADLSARSVANIAPLVEARDDAEVKLLLALNECCDAVKESVDAGRTPLADCPALAKCDPAEQERRIARKAAGPSRKAQNGAAPPRAKTQPSKRIEAVADAFEDEDMRIAIVLRWAAGGVKDPPKWLADILAKIKAGEKGAEE